MTEPLKPCLTFHEFNGSGKGADRLCRCEGCGTPKYFFADEPQAAKDKTNE